MRKLGQHFLRDETALRKIVSALDPCAGETIIEIGAGHGELTEKLGDRLGVMGDRKNRIIAVEKDGELAAQLRKKFAGDDGIVIIHGDIRKILLEFPKIYNLSPRTYLVVGNIPYYLTGYLLRILGELEPKPRRVVLTVQKEVAERVAAAPPRMNRLAASVQFWAIPSIVFTVSRSAFHPKPSVDSATLKLETRILDPEIQKVAPAYYQFVRMLFQQPRQTILNNLARTGVAKKEKLTALLKRMGLDPQARPQTLFFPDLLILTQSFMHNEKKWP